jgi:hypothetical protein
MTMLRRISFATNLGVIIRDDRSPCTMRRTTKKEYPRRLPNMEAQGRNWTSVLCTGRIRHKGPALHLQNYLVARTHDSATLKRIKAYMPNAERRVKSHINVSKFMPRCERDKFLDLVLLMLASQRSSDDDEDGETKNGQENRPLYPNGFTMMLKQLWKQVKNGDA